MAWSDCHLRRPPASDHELLIYFEDEVEKFHATREDINTWFNLGELDGFWTFSGKA